MSMHTPGPLRVRDKDGDVIPIDAPPAMTGYDRREICIVSSWDEEHQEANAYLIAAAPELLEACKDLMSGFSVKTQADEVLMKETQWIIAKAEGR